MKRALSVVLSILLLSMTMVVAMPTYAEASSKICAVSGCNRKCNSGRYCYNHTCIKSGCNSKRVSGSSYCSAHSSSKKSTTTKSSKSYSSTSKKSKKTYHDSYDDGYDSIYEDDDYDWDRYWKDDDYARGVDDAMEDCYDDFGDDW